MYGFFAVIGIPFGWLMKAIYAIIPDYGAAIIVFTLLTRLLIFPFTWKQTISSERIKAISPQVQKLKKKYQNNPQKLQQEQMALYGREGINPMAGCLPAILQMILVMGVLDVVYKPLTHILRFGKSFISSAQDAASQIMSPDGATALYTFNAPMRNELILMEAVKENSANFPNGFENLISAVTNFNNKLFGLVDLTMVPSLHPEAWTAGAVALACIPFVAGIFQLISTIYMMRQQKKSNPDMPTMGTMNLIMYLMPIFSVIFAFQVPAGVGFYWAVGALLSVLIQVCLHKYLNPQRVAVIIEKAKAKAAAKPKSKWQLYLEEQQRLEAERQGANAGKARRDRDSDDEDEKKISRKKMNDINLKIIDDARRKAEEKYSDADSEQAKKSDIAGLSEEDAAAVEAARRRLAEKYGEE